MIDMFIRLGKKIIPRSVFEFFQPLYHWNLAWLAALYYGFPSRRLCVIGVTGTNGKSTVVDLLHAIFSEAGESAASASSIRFKIKNKEEINTLKMTMPGRFRMQQFLYDAARAECKYAVIEVTSEGIRQFRHKGIRFSLAVLTNVTSEHIESHGGFLKYRSEKAKLFFAAHNHIINGEDKNKEYFLNIPARNRIVYVKKDIPSDWHIRLLGEFNRENVAAAYQAARFLGVNPEKIRSAIEKFKNPPGRLEFVQQEPFAVVVDYAHTPDALEKAYQTLRGQMSDISKKLICVLGSAGGGRDIWKRPAMGKIAAEHCNEIILTNEDPYDEDPKRIMTDIKQGIANTKFPESGVKEIVDRKDAIHTAITIAGAGDVVVITGKGCEPWLMGPRGAKIAWDDRKIVRDILQKAK